MTTSLDYSKSRKIQFPSLLGSFFLSIFFCVGCSGDSSGPPSQSDGGTSDGTTTMNTIGDPWVQVGALGEGDTRHTLEVRARDNGLLYYCNVQQLNVVDITDPLKPSSAYALKSKYPSSGSGRCQHMDWNDTLVYSTHRGAETQPLSYIAGFDVSQSSHPEVVNFDNDDDNWSIEGIALHENMVYAAIHQDGLALLENDGTTQLKVRAVLGGLDNAWDVAANGTTLYVADGPGGFVVVDASNKSAPAITATLATAGAPQHVEYDSKTQVAYVAAGAGGLLAIDVSDPASPTLLDVFDTPGSAVQVSLAGDFAYVADWNDARVFDISDPSNIRMISAEWIPPQILGNRPQTFTRVLGIGAIGDFAFLGEWKEVYVYEVHKDRIAPDIKLANDEVDLGTDTEPLSRVIVIENEGNQPLLISQITSSHSAIEASEQNLEIPAGSASFFEIHYQPVSSAALEASLSIHSDDPDEAVATIKIFANQPGLGVGDSSPQVDVTKLEGGTWTLADAQGRPVLLAYFATF